MRNRFIHTYEDIISIENLLDAWREFLRGKRNRSDVREFSSLLMYQVSKLHEDLRRKTYLHGGYEAFKIADPKPRDIHKASVRDRLVHHALYRQLYPFFDRTFIGDSYSCRKEKGTHRAINRFRTFSRQVSKNNTRTAWVLKCDVKKFFASIDQNVLMEIVGTYVPDKHICSLIESIVDSFNSGTAGKGLPLGNLTSQLLVNIYMNEFDRFVKHNLKARYYIRYADDFVIFSENKEWLGDILLRIRDFLTRNLRLTLHPGKISISAVASGVDFLGWVHFPNHRVLRTTAKRRMFKNIQSTNDNEAVVRSYLGLMSHGNTRKLRQEVFQTLDLIRNRSREHGSITP